jgi:hypothetical protein
LLHFQKRNRCSSCVGSGKTSVSWNPDFCTSTSADSGDAVGAALARGGGDSRSRSGVAVAFGLGVSSGFALNFFGVSSTSGVSLCFGFDFFAVPSGSGVSFGLGFTDFFFFGGCLAALGFGFRWAEGEGVGDETVLISSRALRNASRFRFSSSLNCARRIGPASPPASSAKTIQKRRRAMKGLDGRGAVRFTPAVAQRQEFERRACARDGESHSVFRRAEAADT